MKAKNTFDAKLALAFTINNSHLYECTGGWTVISSHSPYLLH